MRFFYFLLFLLAFSFLNAYGQGGVKISPVPNQLPDSSALLELESVDKGFLTTRMTTGQRNAIINPADGLIVFNITNGCLEYHFSGQWYSLCGACASPMMPSAGINVFTDTSILWRWDSVTGATGYIVSTTNSPSAGINVGQQRSYQQTGLSCGTVTSLYVWAENACGLSAPLLMTDSTGNCPAFVCGDTLVDIDGNKYPTVQIGTQCWMQTNLKTTRYRNGDTILTNLSNSAWLSTITGAYAIYGNNPINDSIYGKLYNWYAVDDSRGLCPSGWHVPTESEWVLLEQFLGLAPATASQIGWRGVNEGDQLKSQSGWNFGNGNNATGYTGLPAGARSQSTGGYVDLGLAGNWWSSSDTSSIQAWRRGLNSYYPSQLPGSILRRSNFKYHGQSIRCIKD